MVGRGVGLGYLVAVTGSTLLLRGVRGCYVVYVLLKNTRKSHCVGLMGQSVRKSVTMA